MNTCSLTHKIYVVYILKNDCCFCYKSDIHTCSSLLSFTLFADDTNLFISCKNIEELETPVNREMNHVQVWFEDSRLTLNLKKTMLYLNPLAKI